MGTRFYTKQVDDELTRMNRLTEYQARKLQKGEQLHVFLDGWHTGHFHSHCTHLGGFAVRVIVPPKEVPTVFYLQQVKLPKLEDIGLFKGS